MLFFNTKEIKAKKVLEKHYYHLTRTKPRRDAVRKGSVRGFYFSVKGE
jgi:hypothetical protein